MDKSKELKKSLRLLKKFRKRIRKSKKAPPKNNLGREKHFDLLKIGNFINKDVLIKINYQNEN